MLEWILTIFVVIGASTIEPLNLVLGLLIGAILAEFVIQKELRWVLVLAAAFTLNAALHLPFGGRILFPALVANIIQVSLGGWLRMKWKARIAK